MHLNQNKVTKRQNKLQSVAMKLKMLQTSQSARNVPKHCKNSKTLTTKQTSWVLVSLRYMMKNWPRSIVLESCQDWCTTGMKYPLFMKVRDSIFFTFVLWRRINHRLWKSKKICGNGCFRFSVLSNSLFCNKAISKPIEIGTCYNFSDNYFKSPFLGLKSLKWVQ